MTFEPRDDLMRLASGKASLLNIWMWNRRMEGNNANVETAERASQFSHVSLSMKE